MGNERIHPYETLAITTIERFNKFVADKGADDRYDVVIERKNVDIPIKKPKSTGKVTIVEAIIMLVVKTKGSDGKTVNTVLWHSTFKMKDYETRFNTYKWRGELFGRLLEEALATYCGVAKNYKMHGGKEAPKEG